MNARADLGLRDSGWSFAITSHWQDADAYPGLQRRQGTQPTAARDFLRDLPGHRPGQVPGRPMTPEVRSFRPPGHAESSAFYWRMMMPVCAYSCVIDAINAAVFNAEVRAPVCGPRGVRAHPPCRIFARPWRCLRLGMHAQIILLCAAMTAQSLWGVRGRRARRRSAPGPSPGPCWTAGLARPGGVSGRFSCVKGAAGLGEVLGEGQRLVMAGAR